MLQILEIVGIAIVLLVALYLLTRRFPTFGDSLAFVCVLLARLLVKIEWGCEKAAKYFNGLLDRSLNYPPGVPAIECFTGVAVSARLVYLVVSALIVLGETDNTLLAQGALWQTSTTIQLGGVEIASATLFLCTAALFGVVLLECVGLLPASASLFVPMRKLLRWIIGIVTGLFTVVSLLVVADFYLFRGVYLINPDTAQPMTLWILAGLGLITAAASILALWGLVVGICGMLSVVFWLLSCGFAGMELMCSLPPSLLDVLAVHLSDGKWGVYHPLEPAHPYKVPPPFFGGYVHITESTSSLALSDHTGETRSLPGAALPGQVKEQTETEAASIPVEKELSSQPAKSENSKLGVRRSLELFHYEKEYLPTAEQPMNGSGKAESTTKTVSPSKKSAVVRDSRKKSSTK